MPAIGLLGTGAIGTLMAYHWRALPVVVLPKNTQHRLTSLQLIHQQQLWQAKLPAWQGEPLAWLAVCTKAAATLPALQAWRPWLPKVQRLLLIQNGMGQQQQVQDWLWQEQLDCQLWAAMCSEGAYRQGEQVHYVGQGQTLIGRWQADTHLDAPELPHTQKVPDIQARLRQKLAINAVINPLTGHYRCLNGELLSVPQYHEHLLALCAEISALYQALGWPLAQPLATQAQAVAHATALNRSSTLQDLEAQRPTELSYICGYLLEQAARIGFALPLTSELMQQL